MTNPTKVSCPVCNGDDWKFPCLYPSEGRIGCLRDTRLSHTKDAPASETATNLDTPCIPWEGRNNGNGYGRITVGGRQLMAHRYLWEQKNGKVPDGMQLDHLCRNRSCVNLSHLEVVTCKINVLRGVGPTAQNARKTHCVNGHPFNGENLAVYKGVRRCRTCERKRGAEYKIRRRIKLSSTKPTSTETKGE